MHPFLRSCLPALAMASIAGSEASDAVVVPRIETPPTIDGKLDDAAWKTAVALKDFTVAAKPDPAKKTMEARLCSTDQALFISVTTAEPAPGTLRAEAKGRASGVWQDDCIEVFIRAGQNQLDYDQFITNANGAQEAVRRRNGKPVEAAHAGWRVASATTADSWTVEFMIPATDVDIDQFRRADLIGLKIGREDRTQKDGEVALSIWPPKAPYNPVESVGRAYIESANILISPDGADQKRWGGDGSTSGPAKDGDATAWRFTGPTRLQQDVRLRPGQSYKMSFEAKAGADALVRMRAPQADPKADEKMDLPIAKSDAYVAYSKRFAAGPSGKGLMIIGLNEVGTTGTWIRNLSVAPDIAPANSGAAIPVKGDAEPLVVTKLRVTDARMVRAFCGSAVDGSVKSGQWDGDYWEYNQPGGGAGVNYAYLNNNGYHITFADKLGFQAVVVRGGVQAKLYRDVVRYDDASSGSLVHEFPGQSLSSRTYLKEVVATDRVSFFDVGDGRLADCSFFRVKTGLGGLQPATTESVTTADGSATEAVQRQLTTRFEAADRKAYALGDKALGDKPAKLDLPGQCWIHLLSNPLAEETPLAAIGVDLTCDAAAPGLQFSVRVQDPLNPRLELHGADYELSSGGRARVVCDFPDQIVPKGAQLWLSLRVEQPVTLSALRIERYTVTRDQAKAEALAHRLFLLRSMYCVMSEARPWNAWWKQEDVDAFLATDKPYTRWVKDICDTLAQCKVIDPADDLVRQYDQWIHQNILRRAKQMPPYPTRFDRVDGAPEWAVLAHQAWMQAREVPKWWLDHRMVPTGEIGGEVGDDTDMFANYAPFPFFERDGVAGQVLRAGALLAETAESNNLELGWNKRSMDPLHAYEEGMNLESFMSLWHYGDPVYFERCLVAARGLENATFLLPNGHRHFKRWDTGSIDAKTDRAPEGDGQSHCLMLHPALAAAWYSGNPRIVQMLSEYGRGWVAHQEPGKYAASLKMPEDVATETDSMPYPAVWGMGGSVYVGISEITGDPLYVKPYTDWLAQGKWTLHAAELVQMGMYAPTEANRDAFAKNWQTDLIIDGRKDGLIAALKSDIEDLQRFKHMYTAVECFTDRVFLYPLNNVSTAYTGGYSTRNKLNHPYAVSWEGLGTDYAALVTAATASRLKVLICNLSDKPITGQARVWRLDHGTYDVTLGADADGDDRCDQPAKPRSLPLGRGSVVAIALPPKSVQVLEVVQTAKLEDLRTRPDLALSRLDLSIVKGRAVGRVHNIGNQAADAVVSLIDPTGKVTATAVLGRIEAPLDLVPRTIPFELAGVPEGGKGCAVAVDLAEAVPELYEGNNRVPLPE